ncbi:methionyl-tRNA formyltransferase [bacterium]|nr:methionyl-tRNA formyltransferase [bacterium]
MYKKRVLFVGIPDMAYVCLDGLIKEGVNIVGVLGPKKSHNTYFAFKDYVVSRKLNFIEYESLKDENFLQTLRDLELDIAVVCSFNYKIPKVMLDIPKDGFVNVHPSLLPKYRGGNPYSAVIMNNEKESGVTLHLMDEGFDTGDILLQKKFPLNTNETMGTLFNKTNFMGLEMLIEVLQNYELGILNRTKQPEGVFPVGNGIDDEDLFIDFNKTPDEIERFVRALNPFLNASCMFRGIHVKVYWVETAYDFKPASVPLGHIEKIENNKMFIAVKNGYIIPTMLQFGSFFVCNSKKFIEIIKPNVGEEFIGKI